MALAKIADVRAVEPLIQSLKDEALRRFAANALGKIGDKRAVEPLIQALNDENDFVRSSAAKALGNLGDKRAVEPLIQRLKGDRDQVRKEAEDALNKLGWRPFSESEEIYTHVAVQKWDELVKVGKLAVETLADVLKNSRSPDVRKNVAKTLGKIGERSAVLPLIHALKDEDWHVRANAAEALGRIADTQAVEPLIRLLNTGWQDIVPELGKLLSETHSDIAVPDALVKAWGYTETMNNYCETMKNTAWALGEIRDEHAVDSLFNTLFNTSDYVRSKAGETLSKVVDKSGQDYYSVLKGLQPGTTKEMRDSLKQALAKIGKPTAKYILTLRDKDRYFGQERLPEAFTRIDVCTGDEIQELLTRLLAYM